MIKSSKKRFSLFWLVIVYILLLVAWVATIFITTKPDRDWGTALMIAFDGGYLLVGLAILFILIAIGLFIWEKLHTKRTG